MKKNMRNEIINKCKKGYAAFMLAVMMTCSVGGLAPTIAYAAGPRVVYQAHVSGLGWMGDVINGVIAGTQGQCRAIECVTIEIKDTGYSGGVRYKVHMSGKGWSDWVYDDRPCGTTGEGRQTEAIMIELYGEVAKHFDIKYRTHCQNIGWTQWTTNGLSGTTGQGLRMEGLEIVLVKKNNDINTLNFAGLQKTYPDNSKWNSSFMNKAWQCHGFVCTLGYALSNKDPYTWSKAYNLDNVKPGDIIRFSRPHSIMVTAVNGSEITYVDCNWVGKNTVKWNQKIQKNKLTSKFGTLSYVMRYPN